MMLPKILNGPAIIKDQYKDKDTTVKMTDSHFSVTPLLKPHGDFVQLSVKFHRAQCRHTSTTSSPITFRSFQKRAAFGVLTANLP